MRHHGHQHAGAAERARQWFQRGLRRSNRRGFVLPVRVAARRRGLDRLRQGRLLCHGLLLARSGLPFGLEDGRRRCPRLQRICQRVGHLHRSNLGPGRRRRERPVRQPRCERHHPSY